MKTFLLVSLSLAAILGQSNAFALESTPLEYLRTMGDTVLKIDPRDELSSKKKNQYVGKTISEALGAVLVDNVLIKSKCDEVAIGEYVTEECYVTVTPYESRMGMDILIGKNRTTFNYVCDISVVAGSRIKTCKSDITVTNRK